MKRKLKRFAPCPVLVHPTLHPAVPGMRKAGLICMGPYHNDMWYIFYPKPRPQQPKQQTPRKWYQFWKKGTYHA